VRPLLFFVIPSPSFFLFSNSYFHPTWLSWSDGVTTVFCNTFSWTLINSIASLTTSMDSAWMLPCWTQRIWKWDHSLQKPTTNILFKFIKLCTHIEQRWIIKPQ
jgi:hypothetical protein